MRHGGGKKESISDAANGRRQSVIPSCNGMPTAEQSYICEEIEVNSNTRLQPLLPVWEIRRGFTTNSQTFIEGKSIERTEQPKMALIGGKDQT